MKPRARRAVIGAATLVAVLVGILVFAHWATVRDHVQAWRFQLTRETRTIEPLEEGFTTCSEHVLHALASELRCPVIFDPHQGVEFFSAVLAEDIAASLVNSRRQSKRRLDRALLEENGSRVLEQRVPRRAYVVIRDPDPPGWERRY